MTIPVFQTSPGVFTPITGNPVLTRLDGLALAPLATIISPAFSDVERAEYGVFLAIEFIAGVGYHIIGSPTYGQPDSFGQPYYVQQSYDVVEDDPPGPSLDDRITALELDWSTGGAMRSAIEDAILTIPTKATATPTAVAASGAAGSAETKFALEDHAHAINSIQQASINALNSAVGVQQSLTGGLNTPAPATATPSNHGTAAIGASTKYAREDHVHNSQALPAASNTTPADVATTGAVGVATSFARGDHVHKGLTKVEFTFNISIAVALLTGGVVVVVTTGITGLLTTDSIVEFVPNGSDMPDPLGIAWNRISAAGTLRTGILVPRLLTLGATNVAMKLTVLR